ncbi:hypothetical protein FB45DRAFT_1034544 [Roridomyces roridus]|uniref:Secreted protein n=1 Tax=Roridomyces roridus TaxID=1738132 RepID=A0AAD7BD37_9AGAR|nr:hypothetical protein FB45DRAFT_1034544 [Roridomyces roridus]
MLVPSIASVLGILSHGVGVVSAASRLPGLLLFVDPMSTVGLPVAATISVARSALAAPTASSQSSVVPASSIFASTSAIANSSSPSSSAKVSGAPQTSSSPAAKVARFQKRAAIPECLKTVELSCLNMAANCI